MKKKGGENPVLKYNQKLEDCNVFQSSHLAHVLVIAYSTSKRGVLWEHHKLINCAPRFNPGKFRYRGNSNNLY